MRGGYMCTCVAGTGGVNCEKGNGCLNPRWSPQIPIFLYILYI